MKTRALAAALVLVLGVVACGDDGDSPPPPGGGGPGPAPGAPATAGGAIVPQTHVEDRVPQAERATIRHTFRERDFANPQNGQNRDPFQSYVIAQPGLGPDTTVIKIETTPQCTEKQLVATNYSYAELKLVGIVAEGTQRKVLMMDTGNLGHIIHRNDCVGKEKAFVKDIGDGYVTFEVTSDSSQGNRPEEHSVQLHNNQLSVNEPPSESVHTAPTIAAPNAPTIAPPNAPPKLTTVPPRPPGLAVPLPSPGPTPPAGSGSAH